MINIKYLKCFFALLIIISTSFIFCACGTEKTQKTELEIAKENFISLQSQYLDNKSSFEVYINNVLNNNMPSGSPFKLGKYSWDISNYSGGVESYAIYIQPGSTPYLYIVNTYRNKAHARIHGNRISMAIRSDEYDGYIWGDESILTENFAKQNHIITINMIENANNALRDAKIIKCGDYLINTETGEWSESIYKGDAGKHLAYYKSYNDYLFYNAFATFDATFSSDFHFNLKNYNGGYAEQNQTFYNYSYEYKNLSELPQWN